MVKTLYDTIQHSFGTRYEHNLFIFMTENNARIIIKGTVPPEH